jgi:KDO2-lipid IV(A) lauroyltransferase
MGKNWRKRMRRNARKRLRNRVLLALVRGPLALVGRLPPPVASRLGESLGRIGYLVLGGARRRTLRHLSLAFGETAGSPRVRRISRATFRVFGANAMEWIAWLGRGPEAALDAIVGIEGEEHLERARGPGNGVLGITAHFGLFELLPVVMFRRFPVSVAIGRRATDAALDRFVVENRDRMGVPTVPQSNAREILRVLKRGGIAGVLPDQDLDKLQGAFAPFFGKSAWTPTGPATISCVTGAPLVPMFIVRVGPARHRIVVCPKIPDPGGKKEERVAALTRGMNRVFERVIAGRPEHWAWFHERWATTPEGLARRRERRAAVEERRRRRREGR